MGFAAGAIGTVVGAGGGFLLVPLLLLLEPEWSPEEVTSTSLAVVVVTVASGVAAYARQGRIDYRAGLLFAAASVPSAALGASLTTVVPAELFAALFGAGMVVLGGYLFVRSDTVRLIEPVRGRWVIRRQLRDRSGNMFVYAFHWLQGAAVASLTSLIASLFGIGGGIFQVPVYTRLLHFPMHAAVATSQFVTLFVASEATLVHVLQRSFAPKHGGYVALLALGAIPGAQAGAWIARRTAEHRLARILSLLIALVGARLLLRPILG